MRKPAAWTQQWDATGVRLVRDGASGQETRVLTHEEIAALTDYDARMLGLPRLMDAVMVVGLEGRIDHPAFAVTCVLEPLSSLHVWAVYRREGARLFVGERQLRLNIHQYALFEALDGMRAAGADIAARLQRWPALSHALHAPRHARILVKGAIPRLYIERADTIHPASMQRQNDRLQNADPVLAEWAMMPHRRYVLRRS